MPKAATVQNAGISLFALMLSGMVAYAAEPTGPLTLENLLAAADPEPQAAVVADEASDEKEAEEPPAVRKNDPLQQRLDAALAEYNPAIERAIDELAKEIEEEFNKATKKGDVELARKCKEAEENLREKGTPPKDDFLKHAREDAYRKITRAGAKLAAEFEAAAKECLKAGDLDRAEAVLSERAELLAEMKGWRQPLAASRVPRSGRVSVGEESLYLSDMQDEAVSGVNGVKSGLTGRRGELWTGRDDGGAGGVISVGGVVSPKGIATHPGTSDVARVLYRIPRGCVRFMTKAAINDSVADSPADKTFTQLVFKVFGDKTLLWASKPMQDAGQSEVCDVRVEGYSALVLVVECPGSDAWAHAVWIDPVLLAK